MASGTPRALEASSDHATLDGLRRLVKHLRSSVNLFDARASAADEINEIKGRSMPQVSVKPNRIVRWGIYHRDREFAREAGDVLLGIVNGKTKAEAEAKARHRGLAGATGIWAHPLPDGTNQRV
jgi:hypothetical protein